MDTNKLLHLVIKQISVGVVILDQEYRIQYWNDFMEVNSNFTFDMVKDKTIFEVFPEYLEKWVRKKIDTVLTLDIMSFTSWQQRPYLFDFPSSRPVTERSDKMYQNITFFPMHKPESQDKLVGILIFDATEIAMQHQALEEVTTQLQMEKNEQAKLIKKLEEAQAQLLQSEKMAAVGQLAAGIAHEINNPMAFVTSNVNTLDNCIKDLFKIITIYDEAIERSENERLLASTKKAKEDFDFEFLQEDLKDLLKETKDGAGRVKKIVQDLKDFSHVDESEWIIADLHKGLDSTLNVVWNEVKYKADVIKNYGDIPSVECIASQINQVFMNLIINASHAIEEKGTIIITTRNYNDNKVQISIKDDGKGIEKKHIKRLFEPFFTTKPIGKGTGLGLSLSFNIIKKHHGSIDVNSEVGKGTEFIITLPVDKKFQDTDTASH